MSETTRLKLPFIMPSQAQKHVTHNEALALADVVIQLCVASRSREAAPEPVADGASHIVPAGAGGAWAGRGGQVAAWESGAWQFLSPGEGWRCWVADEARLLVHTSGNWQALSNVAGEPFEASAVGIGTAPDATNRLAVKSDAVLFSHDDVTPGTGDMRITLNKSSSLRDAGLVFQTGYSSRALLGTFGSDALVLKVSADGAAFVPVLAAEPGGKVALRGAVDPAAAQPIQLNGAVRVAADTLRLEAASATTVSLQLANLHSGAQGGYTLSATGSGTFSIADAAGGLRLVVAASGNILPGADNAVSLGEAGRRFTALHAATGVIQTSDARDKRDMTAIPPGLASALVDAIEPVTFRWRQTSEDASSLRGVAAPDARRHAGFLAQDVRAALIDADMDLAVWGRDDEGDAESRQWLRPDQMIPLLWAALKETRRELARLSTVSAQDGPGRRPG